MTAGPPGALLGSITPPPHGGSTTRRRMAVPRHAAAWRFHDTPPHGGSTTEQRQTMAQPPAIDDGDQPIELNIALSKIQEIVLTARSFDQEEFPDEIESAG